MIWEMGDRPLGEGVVLDETEDGAAESTAEETGEEPEEGVFSALMPSSVVSVQKTHSAA
jgi:hypothetical protein